MKKTIFLISLIFLFWETSPTQAQNANNLRYPILLKELNRDIWIPYSEAYRTNDVSKFSVLLSQDFIIVYPFTKSISNLAQHTENIQHIFEKRKEEKSNSDMQFRFSERIITEDFASESGAYRENFLTSHGEAQSRYLKFLALCRKEKGVWKIVSFYTYYEKNTLTSPSFTKRYPWTISANISFQ